MKYIKLFENFDRYDFGVSTDFLRNKEYFNSVITKNDIYFKETELEDIRKILNSTNIDKLKKLNWNPTVTVEEGFKRTISSFL